MAWYAAQETDLRFLIASTRSHQDINSDTILSATHRRCWNILLVNKAPYMTQCLRTIQPTAQPHQPKLLQNSQEETLSIPCPNFQKKFQVPPPHVLCVKKCINLHILCVSQSCKHSPLSTYLNILIIVCHNLPQPWNCYLTLIKKPGEIDIVSLPLVTHLHFSPEEIYESKKLKIKNCVPKNPSLRFCFIDIVPFPNFQNDNL